MQAINAPQVLLKLFGVAAGPEPWMHANSMEINVSEELWSSRHFHNQEAETINGSVLLHSARKKSSMVE